MKRALAALCIAAALGLAPAGDAVLCMEEHATLEAAWESEAAAEVGSLMHKLARDAALGALGPELDCLVRNAPSAAAAVLRKPHAGAESGLFGRRPGGAHAAERRSVLPDVQQRGDGFSDALGRGFDFAVSEVGVAERHSGV